MHSEIKLAIAPRVVTHFYETSPTANIPELIDTTTLWFNRVPVIGDLYVHEGRSFKIFSVNDLRDFNGLIEAKLLAQ